MKTKALLILIFTFFLTQKIKSQSCNFICNADFDSIQFPSAPAFPDSTQMPCWHTTANDKKFEVWLNGYNGVPAYSGNQFLELNAYFYSTIYQSFYATQGTALNISFAHRGRTGVDSMSVSIEDSADNETLLGLFGDGNAAWGYYSLNYVIPSASGNNFTLKFNSVYVTGNHPQIGNFLDAVSVCQTNVGIKEDVFSNSIQIFPNPATENLNIQLENENLNYQLKVYNLLSQLVFIQNFNESNSIDIKNLPEGTYVYEVIAIYYSNTATTVKRGKFLKL